MLKKQYLKTRPACKVTFRISKHAAKSAREIALVGDFNDWNVQATPMTALKNGEFTTVLELDTGKSEYQFRYLYDGSYWENDWEADGYVTNGVAGENGIVRI
ncbi:MAG: isoamylase early set domain-containing protein [Candidatus Thiothrix putei]|uniref:Carbohydrate-binding module 48 (Isoamylase N-terminal domain) n=2 Tax=Thiothrix TaxID=1030 RepID=A0A1H4DSH5_9GAMM|nr:isoamylase early set domain-containing protein [Thiothrix caldifontis]WGZ96076.1 MAG: isoamylase early set domain-containing protein [Candidatus Thiothrix putei]SEA75142.1 Carbohydrate-binding module 48 (Isoamylase N-terminal domain) [Thiothrix caldifontis]